MAAISSAAFSVNVTAIINLSLEIGKLGFGQSASDYKQSICRGKIDAGFNSFQLGSTPFGFAPNLHTVYSIRFVHESSIFNPCKTAIWPEVQRFFSKIVVPTDDPIKSSGMNNTTERFCDSQPHRFYQSIFQRLHKLDRKLGVHSQQRKNANPITHRVCSKKHP